MKKISLIVLILGAAISVALSQTNTSKQATAAGEKEAKEATISGPKMTFESKVINYGEIEQDADPYRYFKFTNTGNEPLIITSAKGSCGCTVPTYPKEAIKPGETAEIKVRYATNRIGPFKKTVTLTTNDSQEETIVLTIEGKVNQKSEEPAGVPQGEGNMFKNSNSNNN